MRTDIEIDDALLAEAMDTAHLPTERETVEAGLRLLVRLNRQSAALAALEEIGWEGDLDLLRSNPRQPAAVTRNGRESTVLISVEEYQRLKRRDREVLAIEDFVAADIDAISRAEPSAEAAAFNDEVAP